MGESEIPTDSKTSLPPRKRAKTQEEKEQRRIERILRNRKAAHASREKKRKHVEFLEKYVLDVEKQLQLVSTLNGKLLNGHYKGGDSDVDKLVSKISQLPDLKKMKMDHNVELDNTSINDFLPRTPESFSSSSPKSIGEDFDVPELDSRNSSIISSDEKFTVKTSPESSPETVNKFSLDIISDDLNFKQPLFAEPIFIKQEDIINPNEFTTTNTTSTNVELSQFPEQLTTFGDYQVNTFDNDFEFDELRNPAVITINHRSESWLTLIRSVFCPVVSFIRR